MFKYPLEDLYASLAREMSFEEYRKVIASLNSQGVYIRKPITNLSSQQIAQFAVDILTDKLVIKGMAYK